MPSLNKIILPLARLSINPFKKLKKFPDGRDPARAYTSLAFGKRCREVAVRPSMGSVDDCFDNAMWESFFATLECELLSRRRFKTQVEARIAVFDFIEGR